jgi:hypothetical protein
LPRMIALMSGDSSHGVARALPLHRIRRHKKTGGSP